MRGALIALLVACGTSGPGPHDIVACVGWTNATGQPIAGECERECETEPTGSDGQCVPSGFGSAGLNGDPSATCESFVGSDGEQGCCLQGAVTPADETIRFYECE